MVFLVFLKQKQKKTCTLPFTCLLSFIWINEVITYSANTPRAGKLTQKQFDRFWQASKTLVPFGVYTKFNSKTRPKIDLRFSRTFNADKGEFLFLPPPCEDPELLLPDLSLPSIPRLVLGPTRCWPVPRRRPSWRLSLDIDSRYVQYLLCIEYMLTFRVISLSVLVEKHVTIYDSRNNRTPGSVWAKILNWQWH